MKISGIIFAFAIGLVCLWGYHVDASRQRALASPPAPPQSTALVALAPAPLTQNAAPQPSKWGNLSGRFLYGDEPPAPANLELNKDLEYCSPFELQAEQLLVNQKNRGIANVVLWLEMPRRGQVPPIHQSYAKTEKKPVELSNHKCRFTPHITLLRTTQKLALKNEDTIAHNTSAGLKRNLPFNAVTPAGSTDQRSVRKPERGPVKISCSIHAWMTGWLLVQDHPYMAVTDAEGRFKIENLPAGEWTFQVWHEIPQAVTAASKNGENQEWKKGEVTLTIEEGENQFGDWTLNPQLFDRPN